MRIPSLLHFSFVDLNKWNSNWTTNTSKPSTTAPLHSGNGTRHGSIRLMSLKTAVVISKQLCHSRFNFPNDVVDCQAKRKTAKNDWSLAGQVFCEMLGQLSHPTIYSFDELESLDVPYLLSQFWLQAFVIHVRHTSARLFHCKFPVGYLRNIGKFGSDYRAKVEGSQGVCLNHTTRYELRDPTSRGKFFNQICKLITYLSKGESRVPFLWNQPLNPLHTVFPWLQASFNIETTGHFWPWSRRILVWASCKLGTLRLCTVGFWYWRRKQPPEYGCLDRPKLCSIESFECRGFRWLKVWGDVHLHFGIPRFFGIVIGHYLKCVTLGGTT